ncbi:MAG: hypothetical protein RLO80_04045 [Hyphomonas sp.]
MSERDPFQSLWIHQQQEPFRMTTAELRGHAARFQSKIRTRNITEDIAGLLVAGIFGWMAFLIPVLTVKIGAVLVILGEIYVFWKLHTLAGASAKSELDAAASIADFHRDELLRQRRALSTVWRWYLAPFVPGMLVFAAGAIFATDTGATLTEQWVQFGLCLAVMAAVFGAVWWLNAQAVKALDKEIKALDEAG